MFSTSHIRCLKTCNSVLPFQYTARDDMQYVLAKQYVSLSQACNTFCGFNTSTGSAYNRHCPGNSSA